MKIQIHQILTLNKLQYLNFVNEQYNAWCKSLSDMFLIPARELQINRELYNWFLAKWDARVVTPFLKENEEFILAGIQGPVYWDLFLNHVKSPYSMRNVFPGVLINNIKKQHYKKINS
ncbi:MAG TPA: hypothetical protein VFF15_08195 [Flavobacteriaceae bacterium]|nr:hypothetical protein [Flavobacteriaceae bacterium]